MERNISPIVFHGKDCHSCGYCKTLDENTGKFKRTPDRSVSVGFSVYNLPASVYEGMMYRNMRRSGNYYYQPTNMENCCPQYAIRLNVLDFIINKKQKKVLHKMENYLKSGSVKSQVQSTGESDKKKRKIEGSLENILSESLQKTLLEKSDDLATKLFGAANNDDTKKQLSDTLLKIKFVTKKEGTFSCNVAFVLFGLLKKNNCNVEKKEIGKEIVTILIEKDWQNIYHASISLEDNGYINLTTTSPAATHPKQKSKPESKKASSSTETKSQKTLTTVLLSSDFRQEEFELYKKYQKNIHKEDSTERGYKGFLCESTLIDLDLKHPNAKKPLKGYGSFHLQYRLDNKLIAVSVLDIVPSGISSVYFFYDSDYDFLSLGVYSALYEIEMIKKECETFPDFKYMYLGFYIHSCQKMKYKAQYYPSEVLCNETFTWVPLDKQLLQKLDQQKYFKFNEAEESVREKDFPEIEGIYVLFSGEVLPAGVLSLLPLSAQEKEKFNYFKRVFGKDLTLNSGFAYYIDTDSMDDDVFDEDYEEDE